jgi:SAM-dependent methyltransferase
LKTDEEVARRYALEIKTVHGDMNDLSVFESNSFDLVFNPCSTCFVPDVENVYREVSRVLKKGGIFMTGFTNPVYNLFDLKLAEDGEFRLKYSQPYSDIESLDESEFKMLSDKNEPLVYGHSLTAFLNGQLVSGLSITHLYEDYWGNSNPVDKFFPPFIATRAVKL